MCKIVRNSRSPGLTYGNSELSRALRFRHFQDTYGSMDVEQENLQGSGWFTEDPREITGRFGGAWKTADFQAGDVLVFTNR